MATTSAPPDQHPEDPSIDGPDRIDGIDGIDDDLVPVPSPGPASDPLAGLERVEASLGATRKRRRIDVRLLLASFGIAIGLVIVVLGLLRSVTGREQQGLPDAIENIDPIRGAAQVPQQTRVFVDLVTGYEAIMFIDGVELDVISLDDDITKRPPGLGDGGGEQVVVPPGAIFEPGNNTLTFTPGSTQAFEAFSTGQHTVTIRYWRTEDGPGRFRTFSWDFYSV
ncbi:MAG: hypothetical protein NTZ21_10500 [Actinobacteria bacterium]|nr:hypothetical protein [Actinomycetota bacterium]